MSASEYTNNFIVTYRDVCISQRAVRSIYYLIRGIQKIVEINDTLSIYKGARRMEELLNIADGKDNLPIKEVTEWIFKKNVSLADATQEEIREFLGIAFQHVVGASEPRDRHIPDWDHLRLLMAISSISLFPLPKSIPDISPVTNSGSMFVLILILHNFRGDHIDFIKQYKSAFTQCLKSLENASGTNTFYSQTSAYCLQVLPTILKKSLPQAEFTDLMRGDRGSSLPFFEVILRMNS